MKRKKLSLVITALTLIVAIITTLSIDNLSATTDVAKLGKALGMITLIPTCLAVLLAFITHNVLFSLLMGFLSGVIILAIPYANTALAFPKELIVQTFGSIKNVLFDIENIEIAILCFAVGGMIEVVRSSGGFESLAVKLSKKINTPRKAGLITSLLGCIIFFDDYANALIVGPIMKPITDRVKVSREKLSYIVDSTAAPVTGIALVSSWVAVEVAAIDKGLEIVGSSLSGFSLFLGSIPFCFYCLFCLAFIFLNSLTGRDFGPMLKAEQRARRGEPISEKSKSLDETKIEINNDKMDKRMFVGVGSIVLLVVMAIMLFFVCGRNNALKLGLITANTKLDMQSIALIVGSANTIRLVTISSLIGTVFAVVLGCLYKLFDLKYAIKVWLRGAKNLLGTIIMLLTAWCLADITEKLGATYFVVEIISKSVPPMIVPALIFITCCVISCASGSYGCLFVVMPLAIPLAFRVISMGVNINSETFLLLCVGSVMAGSIFGDHCSPVTDCTILSASGSGCTTMEHCNTQLPYAITCALVSVICGIFAVGLGLNVYLSLLIGIMVEILVLLIIGKKPI